MTITGALNTAKLAQTTPGVSNLPAALGVISPHAGQRHRAVQAYCDALKACETSDVGPGV
jgi:hypothetical protein